MVNFILESEQRVGSRWIHYLLSTLYGFRPSPEVDGHHLETDTDNTINKIRGFLDSGRIPKFHHVNYRDVLRYFPDKKIISIVRNPRDRAVSVAFHHKYDPGKAQWPQRGMTDEDAISYTVFEYDRYPISNERMLNNMVEEHSVLNRENENHIWIPYEWLLEDTNSMVLYLCWWIGEKLKVSVDDAVALHSFENKAKRKAGEEDRTDTWRRKGVNKDWYNWFTDEMITATQDVYNSYVDKLAKEVGIYNDSLQQE